MNKKTNEELQAFGIPPAPYPHRYQHYGMPLRYQKQYCDFYSQQNQQHRQ